jgi:hypothetical protein
MYICKGAQHTKRLSALNTVVNDMSTGDQLSVVGDLRRLYVRVLQHTKRLSALISQCYAVKNKMLGAAYRTALCSDFSVIITDQHVIRSQHTTRLSALNNTVSKITTNKYTAWNDNICKAN